ncbi:MAG: PAS domain S-box protein [Actinobacteria bacterium]|nr:PAS domain S-box protein [Actinomycetota bacterium]MCG2820135.1 PAS domain S-box protein [Actinomycetes bacterium]MBU4219216.1 PAS domain S-box protein [Actinomycetota bacterium]MBU4359059.1 PAS domain S-box protein [Actinomycetota bacterium]MBU4392930.1 PAS domain S-box protein [Actinomycetota bacterium]
MPGDGKPEGIGFDSLMENVTLAAIQGIDRNGVILHWNAGSEKLYGFPAAEAVGQRLSELIMSGTASAQLDRALGEAWESGRAVPPSAWPVTNKKGERLWVYTTLLPVSREGSVTEVFCMGIDMTGRKRVEEKLTGVNRLYSVFRKTGKAIVRCREPEELYEQVCRIAVEDGGFLMAWVGIVDPTNQLVMPVAHWGSEKGYLEKNRNSILEIPDGLGPTGTSVREDRYDICQDIENNPRFAPWRDEALERRYRSNAAFPLRIGSETIGALTLYADRPRFFDSEQVDLLESLAEDISFAIEGMDSEERRKGAQEALRRSEEYFRSLIENALDIICILDSKGAINYTSPSVERLLGYKRSELREKSIFDFLPKDEPPGLTGALSRIVGNPGSIGDAETLFRHKDGSWRTLEAVGKSYTDESGNVGVILNARDVTGRKRMEEELRRSEETQRALLNALSDSAYLIDAEGTILAINEMGAMEMGGKVDDVVGGDLFEMITPEVVEERRLKAGEVVSTAQPIRFESEMNGAFADISIYPIVDKLGQVSRLAILSRDITQRKKDEEAQRKDRDFVSAVINTTGALVVVTDSEGRIILFNSTCEQITGYSFSEVSGRHTWEVLLVPEEVERIKEMFAGLGSGEYPDSYECHWLTRHGARRLISWSNTVLHEKDGSIGFVIGTGIDFTERKKAEEALKESVEQYRAIFESTGTAMCIIDDNATVTFLNQEFERMTGYSAREVEGEMDFTGFLAPDDREEFLKHHRDTREVRRNVPVHFECELMDKRGNALSMFANMGFIPGRNSSVLSLVDLSKEKGYERDLQETAERLRHFLTVASHELRHPVTVVKGYATTLAEYMEEMPRELILDLLGDINSAANRLTRYVSELMDVSRVEEGRFPIERKAVDPAQLLRMSIEDMRMMEIQNEFAVKVDPGCGLMNVDPGKFVQLMVILLENAVQFSPPGSRVDIEVGKRNRGFIVDVKDQGVGITEEDQDSVFDRFFQVEETIHHSTPGIGLGLYIAREIIRGHGGEIHCRPREGGGTVFRFSIP